MTVPDTIKLCLAHRYLYYVLSDPVISDYDYDMLERSLTPAEREALGVGSELAADYSTEVIELAEKLRQEAS